MKIILAATLLTLIASASVANAGRLYQRHFGTWNGAMKMMPASCLVETLSSSTLSTMPNHAQ
jgi:hypothetical protein